MAKNNIFCKGMIWGAFFGTPGNLITRTSWPGLATGISGIGVGFGTAICMGAFFPFDDEDQAKLGSGIVMGSLLNALVTASLSNYFDSGVIGGFLSFLIVMTLLLIANACSENNEKPKQLSKFHYR